MKFLRFKSSNVRHISSPSKLKGKPPPVSKFFGWQAEVKTEEWLSYRHAIAKQLKKIVNSVNEDTTLEDLSDINPGHVGSLERALILKNRLLADVYNPSQFYLLFENGDYSLQNSEWIKYFPAFISPVEAHRCLHVLLRVYYRMYQDKMKGSQEVSESMQFLPGQLVFSNVEMDGNLRFEVRRGCIKNVNFDKCKSQWIYTVYLLDFGFHVECSDNMLCPLPKPFNSIAPLAVECSLYGISPIGAHQWVREVLDEFSQLLEDHKQAVFLVDILSDHEILPSPLVVNVEIMELQLVRKRGPKSSYKREFKINLTQFMIDSQVGVQWNLFPCRPKLMGGVTIPKNQLNERKSHRRAKISFRDALSIAPVYLPLAHKRLPMAVIKRELKKLFRLRCNHFGDVYGLHNYLATQKRDADNRLRTRCSLAACISTFIPALRKEEEDKADDNSNAGHKFQNEFELEFDFKFENLLEYN